MMLLGGLLEGCSKVVGWFVGRVFKSCWVIVRGYLKGLLRGL